MKKLLHSLSFFEKNFLLLYVSASLCLFFYSFTQVDLGLTLTRSSVITDIQRSFQYIGYFNRPLSTLLFLIIIGVFFTLYYYGVKAVKDKKITERGLWLTVSFVAVILAFSYTAFSHDIFNYIFDAKIVTHYQQNPYVHTALDYPEDKMLGFMHWTHRTYPYGPVWLFLTVPLSYLGFQFFLPTYFLFKILSLSSYLLTTFAVFKIAKKVSPDKHLVSTALFALNPIVLIETLISGHNDLIMMAFGMFAILFLLEKKYILSALLLLLSIGVKYATALLLPLLIVVMVLPKKVSITPVRFIGIATGLMALAVIFATYRTNFQPWYLLYVLPFASLMPQAYISLPVGILSIVGLLNYVPYLFVGNWDKPIPEILITVNIAGVILASLLFFYLFFQHSRVKR